MTGGPAAAGVFQQNITAANTAWAQVVGTQVFLENLERLKLEPEKLLSVHALNPDRLATMADIRKSLGR